MHYTKTDAIRLITNCADKYHYELENRALLFISQDKHKQTQTHEFYFFGRNFMHLTGIKPAKELSASVFYDMCLNKRIKEADFEFSPDGTTFLKLDVLPSLITKNLSATMIGKYDTYRPRLYTDKIAGSTNACIGFTVDESSGVYVPNTVVQEDIRNCSSGWARVLAVYRKDISSRHYSEITYLAKGIEKEYIARMIKEDL